jgi:tetratricopeptide (TPR) repeat protein
MKIRLDARAAAGLDRLRRGRFREAAAELEKAAAGAGPATAWLRGRAAEAWSCQGLTWLYAGDLGRAQAAFERALGWCPTYHAARRRLARIHHRLGQPAEALVALDPATSRARGIEHHLLRAVSLDRLGETSRCLAALDDALAAALDDPLDRDDRPAPGRPPAPRAERGPPAPEAAEAESHADAHCRAAARVFERDPQLASERLEAALLLNGDYLRARVLLALADLRLGRAARARVLLERARELQPRYPDVLAWLGLARLAAGDRVGAGRALEQSVTGERGFGRGHRFLSLVRHAEGRTSEALAEARRGLAGLHDLSPLPSRLRVPGLEAEGADEDDLVRGLAIRPRCADLHLALGKSRLAAGEPTRARAALQMALALQPGYAAALFELGRAELEAGTPHQAGALLGRVVRERPGWVDAQALLGRARLRAGDAGGAVAPLRAALKRRPNLEGARDDLQWALLTLRAKERRHRETTAWWQGAPRA